MNAEAAEGHPQNIAAKVTRTRSATWMKKKGFSTPPT